MLNTQFIKTHCPDEYAQPNCQLNLVYISINEELLIPSKGFNSSESL